MSDHGTWSRYTNEACRCDDCSDAARAYQASRTRRPVRRLEVVPVPEGVVHGTWGTYTNYGCGCPDCRHAAQERRARIYRQRRAERLLTVVSDERVPATELRPGELIDCGDAGTHPVTKAEMAKSAVVRRKGKQTKERRVRLRFGADVDFVVPATCKFHRVGRLAS